MTTSVSTREFFLEKNTEIENPHFSKNENETRMFNDHLMLIQRFFFMRESAWKIRD